MPVQSPHIVIVGAGNLAHHLLPALRKAGYRLTLFNHHATAKAKALAKKNQAAFSSDYEALPKEAMAYMICVKDEAIAEVAASLKAQKVKGLVLHTSGSTDLAVLKGSSAWQGVFYPLQTFSPGDALSWSDIPVLIEANTPKALSILKNLASSVSRKVVRCNSKDRLRMHLAAVLVNNFTNALYTVADEFLSRELSSRHFDLLKPLMQQTLRKLDRLRPADAQTGPARRNDTGTMKRHLELLKTKEQKALYTMMSRLIADRSLAPKKKS